MIHGESAGSSKRAALLICEQHGLPATARLDSLQAR
jgi:hypothetical protein